MKKLLIISVGLIFILLLSSRIEYANDPNTIRVPQDYLTIQAAVTAASPGDTIVVSAGIYNEVVNVNIPLTLRGEDGAIVKPDDSTALLDQGVRRVAIYITADDVTVEGFEIDGTGGHVHYGIYGFNTNDVEVRHNVVHDIVNEIGSPVWDVAGVGILFFGWGQGIDGVTVGRNTVYNTGRMAIFVGGMEDESPYGWLPSENNTIDSNVVHDAWIGPTNDGGGAIQINGAFNCTIVSGKGKGAKDGNDGSQRKESGVDFALVIHP